MLNRQKHSGEAVVNLRLRVMDQYKLENKANFYHEKAWEFLRTKPKWFCPKPVVVRRRNKWREMVDLDDTDVDLEEDEEDDDNENPNATLFGYDANPRLPGKSRRPKSTKMSSDSAASSCGSFDDSITSNYEAVSQQKKELLLDAKHRRRYKNTADIS